MEHAVHFLVNHLGVERFVFWMIVFAFIGIFHTIIFVIYPITKGLLSAISYYIFLCLITDWTLIRSNPFTLFKGLLYKYPKDCFRILVLDPTYEVSAGPWVWTKPFWIRRKEPMKIFKEIKAVGFFNWVWFVFYLNRDEFSPKLRMWNYTDMDKLMKDREKAHDIDRKLSEGGHHGKSVFKGD